MGFSAITQSLDQTKLACSERLHMVLRPDLPGDHVGLVDVVAHLPKRLDCLLNIHTRRQDRRTKRQTNTQTIGQTDGRKGKQGKEARKRKQGSHWLQEVS